MPSPITTHVLDTGLGRPAAGMVAELFYVQSDQQTSLGKGRTNSDGRIGDGLVTPDNYRPGIYRLRFAVGDYFSASGTKSFYPEVTITFEVIEGQSHYHIPLLLSPFGYTTYRGS